MRKRDDYLGPEKSKKHVSIDAYEWFYSENHNYQSDSNVNLILIDEANYHFSWNGFSWNNWLAQCYN